MNQSELQQALANLHEELSRTAQFDEATRRALSVLLADIQRVVADPNRPKSSSGQPDQPLALRLRESVQDLEIKHPRLMGLLQQIIDRLAELGI